MYIKFDFLIKKLLFCLRKKNVQMEKLILDGTSTTPEIYLDPISGLCEISGVSMPEDVKVVYKPVMSWLDDFENSDNEKIIFNFRFTYFNTASAKVILDILSKLDSFAEKEKYITINWYYKDGDRDMEEAAEDFADMLEIPIKIHKLQK